jgi:L-lactate dehydrogenase complex protein LldG
MSLQSQYIERARAAGFVVHEIGASVEPDGTPSRAAYALADSGSLVLLSSEEPRSRALLPYVHYTYVSVASILPSLTELFGALGKRLPSCVAIVTGPSSSGDIEMTLTIGVHGPGEEHVILV